MSTVRIEQSTIQGALESQCRKELSHIRENYGEAERVAKALALSFGYYALNYPNDPNKDQRIFKDLAGQCETNNSPLWMHPYLATPTFVYQHPDGLIHPLLYPYSPEYASSETVGYFYNDQQPIPISDTKLLRHVLKIVLQIHNVYKKYIPMEGLTLDGYEKLASGSKAFFDNELLIHVALANAGTAQILRQRHYDVSRWLDPKKLNPVLRSQIDQLYT